MNIKPFSDPLCVIVSRRDVEAQDISSTLTILKRLIESPEIARANMERVDIAFDGYNNTREELDEILEVRNYVYLLDEQFPYWLFLLSKHMLGLQCVMHCFLPPYLTEEAKASIHPEKLEKILVNRWGPAMEHIAKFAGLNDAEIENLAGRATRYIKDGRSNIPGHESG